MIILGVNVVYKCNNFIISNLNDVSFYINNFVFIV